MKLKSIAIPLMLFLLSGNAFSQTISADPKAILDVAKEYGSATLDDSKPKLPRIDGRIEDTEYAIYFLNCDNKGGNCEDVQFYAVWSKDKDKVALAKINDWNKERRFGRAYIDRDNDPVVEMDIAMNGGISKKALDEYFAVWKVMLKKFKEYIK
jgi:hypothetical protein